MYRSYASSLDNVFSLLVAIVGLTIASMVLYCAATDSAIGVYLIPALASGIAFVALYTAIAVYSGYMVGRTLCRAVAPFFRAVYYRMTGLLYAIHDRMTRAGRATLAIRADRVESLCAAVRRLISAYSNPSGRNSNVDYRWTAIIDAASEVVSLARLLSPTIATAQAQAVLYATDRDAPRIACGRATLAAFGAVQSIVTGTLPSYVYGASDRRGVRNAALQLVHVLYPAVRDGRTDAAYGAIVDATGPLMIQGVSR